MAPARKEPSMARPTKLDRDFMDAVTKWLDDNNHNSPTLWIGFIRKDAQLIWEGVQQAILSTKEG